MITNLQLADHQLHAEEIIPLLTKYQMFPQLLCEMIIDCAIASIQCSSKEINQCMQEFDQKWGLTSAIDRAQWCEQYGLNSVQFEELVTRKLRVEKFKQMKWGHRLESYFLSRKDQLDQVVYSLLRVTDRTIATELYFQIQEGEQSFTEAARLYSEGSEKSTGGLMGLVEMGELDPRLAHLLYISSIGQVKPPILLGNWYVLVRVEQLIPAQLDEIMRQRLLQEQFEAWFQEQLKHLSKPDQIWMGISTGKSIHLMDLADQGDAIAA